MDLSEIIFKNVNKDNLVGINIGFFTKDKSKTLTHGLRSYDKENDNLLIEDVMPIGSISKSLLCEAINRWNKDFWNEPLLNHVLHFMDRSEINTEWFDNNLEKLHILDLANHTSGIIGHEGSELVEKHELDFLIVENNDIETRKNFVKHIFSIKPHHKSGGEFIQENYSNFGVGILGAIIENVEKLPYSEFVKKHLLDFLDMHNTQFGHVGIDTITNSYEIRNGGSYDFGQNNLDFAGWKAGGENESNIEDMIKYGQYLLKEKQSLINIDFPTYNLGWFVHKDKANYNYFEHSGLLNGWLSHIFIFPAYDFGFVFLSNSLEKDKLNIEKTQQDIIKRNIFNNMFENFNIKRQIGGNKNYKYKYEKYKLKMKNLI